MTATGRISQAEFVRRATEFLRDRIGPAADSLAPDTELIASGILDSLLVLEFFFFLEEINGGSIPEHRVTTTALATMANAYRFILVGEDPAVHRAES